MNEVVYPEVAKATGLAEQSYELALAVKVDGPEMYEVAGDELRSIVTRRKQIEELRLSITRPIDAAKARVMELFRGPTDRLGQAESLLRDEMTRYQREEREKAEAARREAEAKAAAERAEQERIAREAAEAQRKAAAEAEAARKAGDAAAAKAAEEAAAAERERAEAAREQVELADIAPPTMIATIQPKAAGVATRKTWKHEVTDFRALVLAAAERAKTGDDFLLGFLLPNDKALGTAAKSMQAKLKIDGVRVYAEEGLSVRRKSA
jgi:hypothetical protein